MNYPLRDAVIAYIRDGNAGALGECVNTVYRHYPKAAADTLMNFLGTHDTLRVLTALGGTNPYGYSNEELSRMRMDDAQRERAVRLLKMAYQLICIMPGVPCIFYGDEAGMEGYGDPFCRRPFPWGRENDDLTEFYRHIGTIHRGTPVLRDGYVRLLNCTQDNATVLRYNGRDNSMLMVLNRSDRPMVVRLPGIAVGADHVFRGDTEEIPAMSALSYHLSSSAGDLSVGVERI
jgi:glycosidase